jgi:hypothetical protein
MKIRPQFPSSVGLETVIRPNSTVTLLRASQLPTHTIKLRPHRMVDVGLIILGCPYIVDSVAFVAR